MPQLFELMYSFDYYEPKSYNPHMVESERSQLLQQVRARLDPFRDSPEVEKVRAIGLSNLYLQMANPSVKSLEVIVGKLLAIPYSNLQDLQSTTYGIGESPSQFFSRHDISITDPEKLVEGIVNAGDLLQRLTVKYDTGTGKPYVGEELNPKVLAEEAHENIQVFKGERKIKKAVEQIKKEPDLKIRHDMGVKLKRRVLTYVHKHSFRFYNAYDRVKAIEPTWKNFTQNSRFSTEFLTKGGGSIGGSFGISEAVDVVRAATSRYSFEKRLEKIPVRDRDRFDKLRLQYGAKGANLIMLSELVIDINKLTGSAGWMRLNVPDFQVVPVDLYKAWKDGKPIDRALRSYFKWTKELISDSDLPEDEDNPGYIVRSSAVFSEDGENVTGAGVYDSVRVHGGGKFQDFKAAVEKVFASVDSEKAKSYRGQHGIDKEEMGLVIQKYVSSSRELILGRSPIGYINSRLTGVPELMELVTEQSRNFIKRKELDFFLGLNVRLSNNAFQSVHHFPPDQQKIVPDLPIRVGQLAYVIEKIWGRDVQVEFVADIGTINFVQVRELPVKSIVSGGEVKFPDEKPLHSGSSIGIGDMELSVLDNSENNSEETGAVIFRENDMFTVHHTPANLPKKGAVIIAHGFGGNGHIQTLCSEQGLICIFPDDVYDEDKPTLGYRELDSLGKVRVVSNGIEARVYAKEEKV